MWHDFLLLVPSHCGQLTTLLSTFHHVVSLNYRYKEGPSLRISVFLSSVLIHNRLRSWVLYCFKVLIMVSHCGGGGFC
jgi:hypothetical protein